MGFFVAVFLFFFCFISVIFLLFLVSLRLYIGAFPFMCGDYSSFRENPFKNPLNIYCKSKKKQKSSSDGNGNLIYFIILFKQFNLLCCYFNTLTDCDHKGHEQGKEN